MWQVIIAGTVVILAGLGLLIWQSKRAAAAQAKLDAAQKDQSAREKHDEAVEEWDAGGGLAGGMRDPE